VCLGGCADDGQAEADTCARGRMRSVLRRIGSTSVALPGGELLAVVLDGEHHTLGVNAGLRHTLPCSGRLWTIGLTRLSSTAAAARVSRWSGHVAEVSMVRPRFFLRGQERFGALSAMKNRSSVLA